MALKEIKTISTNSLTSSAPYATLQSFDILLRQREVVLVGSVNRGSR